MMLTAKTPIIDFWSRIGAGLFIAFLIWGVWPAILGRQDIRPIRDLRGVTPLGDVVVTGTVATDTTLRVIGILTK